MASALIITALCLIKNDISVQTLFLKISGSQGRRFLRRFCESRRERCGHRDRRDLAKDAKKRRAYGNFNSPNKETCFIVIFLIKNKSILRGIQNFRYLFPLYFNISGNAAFEKLPSVSHPWASLPLASSHIPRYAPFSKCQIRSKPATPTTPKF